MECTEFVIAVLVFVALIIAAAIVLCMGAPAPATKGGGEGVGAVFTDIYEKDAWGNNRNPNYNGSSGDGSAYRYNIKTYVPFMHKIFKKYNIHSVVDLGCGDFRIGRALYNGRGIRYTGYDTYDKIITYHRTQYDSNFYTFVHSDFTKHDELEKLKPADLCILKDVLQHWPYKTIIEVMDYLVHANKYKYIIVVNCYKSADPKVSSADIEPGGWRPLSISKYPLNRYGGVKLYNWDTKEVSIIIPSARG